MIIFVHRFGMIYGDSQHNITWTFLEWFAIWDRVCWDPPVRPRISPPEIADVLMIYIYNDITIILYYNIYHISQTIFPWNPRRSTPLWSPFEKLPQLHQLPPGWHEPCRAVPPGWLCPSHPFLLESVSARGSWQGQVPWRWGLFAQA